MLDLLLGAILWPVALQVLPPPAPVVPQNPFTLERCESTAADGSDSQLVCTMLTPPVRVACDRLDSGGLYCRQVSSYYGDLTYSCGASAGGLDCVSDSQLWRWTARLPQH